MSLEVVRASGLVTIQDLGRRGHMHEAVPPGGALVPSLLVAANRVAGNADDAPAIEVLGRLVVRALANVAVATDALRELRAGDELEIASEPRRVAYLAMRGGVDAPLVLGGRGTLVSARLGRILRAGDRIQIGELSHRATETTQQISRTSVSSVAPWFNSSSPIRVLPGPDLDAFEPAALAALVSAPYTISPASDRVGTRLHGPALARRTGFVESSRPMVRGAIEVPGDGQPIVLGPEHPTTGGYPLIGVIAADDLDRFFAVRLGGTVRFAIAS